MAKPISLSAVLVLVACGGGSGSQTGEVQFSVTDAPVDDAEQVFVSFSALELLGADDSVRERFVIDPPQRVDLLALQGTQSQLLVDARNIAAGVYQQIRLSIDGPAPSCNNPSPPFASAVVIDGMEFPLVVPSGAQSGLKLNGPITVAAGAQTRYTLDFDLRRSLAERGNTGCYNLRPVIRIVDEAEVGSIGGTVDAAQLQLDRCSANPQTGEGAAVYVYSGAGVTPTEYGDSRGEALTTAQLNATTDGALSYSIGFLLAGDYTLALSCQAGEDNLESVEGIGFSNPLAVAVEANQDSRANFGPPAAR